MTQQLPYEPLSRREREILALLGQNLPDRDIAGRLFVALATVKWYNRQIFNKLGVENRKQAVERANTLGLLAPDGASETVKHNLPSQLTPFVGRSRELAEVQGTLAPPHTRLLTILAPGGMGKTRLALEAAEGELSRYADGVFFVALAALTSPDQVVPALAEALGLQFAPDGRIPQQQLADFLRRKTLLLVLDNFEHLLDAAPTVAELLSAAPKVKALVTSRERLNLNGEAVYPLAGLHYPEADADDPLRFGAVELFVECALRSNPRFTADDAAAIGRLCRRVQGMPLAIELAAASSRVLSVEEIDAEIVRSADFLETSMPNVPERQRSIRAVFEAAWSRLDDRARRTFMRMSVFRGGCTRKAAQAVTGVDIKTLAALVDKALLWRDPKSGRYEIHELLRQYAEAELERAGETDVTRQAHQEFYARLTEEWCYWIDYGRQLEAYAVLDADIENIQHSLSRASERGIAIEVEPFTNLVFYYDRRGWWTETLAVCEYAAKRLGPDDSIALARLWSWQSSVYLRFDMPALLCDFAKRGMDMLKRLDSGRPLPFAMLMYAIGLNATGDWEAATRIAWEAMPIAEANDPQIVAHLYQNLGTYIRHGTKDVVQGKRYHEEALRHFSQRNNYWGMCHVIIALGVCAAELGDLDEAERRFAEAVNLARTIDFHLQIDRGLHNLSLIALEKHDWHNARRLMTEVMRRRVLRGYPEHLIFVPITALAQAAIMLDEPDEARHHLRESISLLNEWVDASGIAWWLIIAGGYFVSTGDFARAATLLTFPEQQRESLNLISVTLRILSDFLNRCRAALSSEDFAAAVERGKSLTDQEAVALVAEAL